MDDAPCRVVGDVMTAGVVAAHENAAAKEVVAAIVRNHISAVPVIDDSRRVVGVVSETDLLARPARGAAVAGDLMTCPPIVTGPATGIAEAVRLSVDAHVRLLPVVDADGVLVGIVTRADLLRPYLRSDEHILGEVRDQVLGARFGFAPGAVDVSVVEGVVSLRGELAGRLAMDSLVGAVRAVSGVIAVDDDGLSFRVDDLTGQANTRS